MMGMKYKLWRCLAVVGLMSLITPIAWASDDIPPLRAPITTQVLREFSVGVADWDSGHRGVDLAGMPGQPVYASAPGTVRYAGALVDRGVVSIEHNGWRTTYEPLNPAVSAGMTVSKGQLIGYLTSGHPGCVAPACLHWGLTDGTRYANPLERLGPVEVRMLPTGIERNLQRGAFSTGFGAPGALVWPAQGRPGSAFGMRLHPILGVYRMHWGTDIGAACGSPLLAVSDGHVTQRSSGSGYGNYLRLDLGSVGGARLEIGYAHAASYTVAVGSRVTRGQVIGYVGTTGLSTGCHLHLEVWRDGTRVDPMTVLRP